jgi:phosphopantetheine attachment domain protein
MKNWEENKMEELLDILKGLKPGVDFENEKNLIEDRLLDSLDVMNLTVELNDEFDIEITPLDILPENFKSIETIYALITRLQDEG